MADPTEVPSKYECQPGLSQDSSHGSYEKSSPFLLSKQSEKLTSLLNLTHQFYTDGEWLNSLKCLSLLLHHVNVVEKESKLGFKDRDHRKNFNSDSHTRTLLKGASRESEIECSHTALQFKSDILTLTNDIIFRNRTNECLQTCTMAEVQEVMEPVKEAYPFDEDVLLSVIHLYFSLDFKDQALHIAIDLKHSFPESVKVWETFENICCHVVDRWHFKMLNDVKRNKAYESAINSRLHGKERKIVCDIGSGTGLLSLISAKYAHHVYAIEKSALMCNIARNILRDKDVDPEHAKRIQILNEMSLDLRVPENLPERVCTLVTEIFDAGLFGEGIISTLSHAWKELMETDQDIDSVAPAVIPQKAKLYVEAISCQDIYQENSFHHDGVWHDINLGSLSIVSVVTMVHSDPYSSCHLKDLPQGYRRLSDAHLLMEVNFNDPTEIFNLERGASGSFDIVVKEEGSLDALVIWFELILTDSIHLSTHPGSEGCWEQAVFPVRDLRSRHFQRGEGVNNISTSPKIFKGDKVMVKYSFEEDRLSLHSVGIFSNDDPPSEEDLHKISTCPQKLLADPSEWWSHDIFCLDEWEISLLNNVKYHTEFLVHMKYWMDSHQTSSTCVIDIHSGFSPMTLQVLYEGCSEIYFLAQKESQKALACKLVYVNNLDMRRLNFFEDLSELMDHEFLPSSHITTEQSPSPHRAALALCEIVDYQGRLTENLESNFEYLRYILFGFSSYHLMPERIDIYGVFVESDRLRNDSCITSNENTLGFPIGHFFNEYSVTNHPGITFCTLPHRKLTDEFKIFSLDLISIIKTKPCKYEADAYGEKILAMDVTDLHSSKPPEIKGLSFGSNTGVETSEQDKEDTTFGNVPGTSQPKHSVSSKHYVQDSSTTHVKDDQESAIDACFHQSIDLNIPVVSDGKLTAMVYWFDIQLSPSEHIYTNDPSSHWKQAAVMMKNNAATQDLSISTPSDETINLIMM